MVIAKGVLRNIVEYFFISEHANQADVSWILSAILWYFSE
jgi:hypothetical protein